ALVGSKRRYASRTGGCRRDRCMGIERRARDAPTKGRPQNKQGVVVRPGCDSPAASTGIPDTLPRDLEQRGIRALDERADAVIAHKRSGIRSWLVTRARDCSVEPRVGLSELAARVPV